MRLAQRITITIAGEVIELRPSLRFAMRLEARPGSYSQLVRDIHDGSLTAAVEIISDHTDAKFLKNRVFGNLPALQGPLLEYVMACVGIDPDHAPTEADRAPNRERKSVPFAEHLAGLYRIGTGWLGWTPQQTLDATPLEIMEAHKGRMDMLKAIFGSGELAPPKDERTLNEKFRSIFAGHEIIREEA